MTFGITLKKHIMMVTSASIFYIATDYQNKRNMRAAASNINIKH